MQAKRRKRLYFVIFLMAGIAIAVGLSLMALKQNINLYYTPSQLLHQKNMTNRLVRLGGMVVKGSVHRDKQSLHVSFWVTDYHNKMKVTYTGLLPSLFHEGRGVVVQGRLQGNDVFAANQVLAKHNATYKPPGIGKS